MYRRRTQDQVDAIRWLGDNLDEVWEWAGASEGIYGPFVGDHLTLITIHESKSVCDVGDWIIREPGVFRRYYPCRNAVFQDRYEPVPA